MSWKCDMTAPALVPKFPPSLVSAPVCNSNSPAGTILTRLNVLRNVTHDISTQYNTTELSICDNNNQCEYPSDVNLAPSTPMIVSPHD